MYNVKTERDRVKEKQYLSTIMQTFYESCGMERQQIVFPEIAETERHSPFMHLTFDTSPRSLKGKRQPDRKGQILVH